MDDRVFSDPSGPGFNSATSEDGAGYLRNLKNSGSQESSNPPATGAPHLNVECSPTGKERRRSLRYRCSGSAEFRADDSDIRMWGTLTDISLHGCYVEMSTTFPVDTRVELALETLGIRVRLIGNVRVSYPFLGMGISFTEIEPGQQRQLEQMMFALASQGGPAVQTPSSSDKPGKSELSTAVAAAEPQTVLEEVREFFVENRLLSREEFLLIAKRSIHSEFPDSE